MKEIFSILQRVCRHPANNHSLAAIGRVLKWQICKRTGWRHPGFRFHGFRMPGYLDSHSVSAAYYFNGLPDYREMSFAQHYLRPGDRFLDIGANVGIYTLLAASIVGENGHIDAFEPNDPTRQRLQEVIRLNGLNDTVTIHGVAVADSSGFADFGYADDDCQSRLRSTVDSVSSGSQVQTVRLDEYLGEQRFTLAKMDIEGGEPLALRGAEKMLAAGNPPALLLEMAGYSKRFGVSTSALIAQLAQQGYHCGLYEPGTRTIRYTETPWKEGAENVVATSIRHREFVMDRLRGSAR